MDINNIINTLIHYGSIGLLVLYLLTTAVNLIVEVIKTFIPIPTAIVVFIVSIALTELALFIACEVLAITVMWYYAVGAVVLGIVVAYCAMFGFDKIKEVLGRLEAYGM